MPEFEDKLAAKNSLGYFGIWSSQDTKSLAAALCKLAVAWPDANGQSLSAVAGRHGLAVTQHVFSQNGTGMCLATRVWHESGQWCQSLWPITDTAQIASVADAAAHLALGAAPKTHTWMDILKAEWKSKKLNWSRVKAETKVPQFEDLTIAQVLKLLQSEAV